MFTVTTDNEFDSITDFDAWSGGYNWLETFKKHPRCIDYINDELDDLTSYRVFSTTDINDYLWFDAADSLKEAGLYNDETGLFYDEEGFEAEDEEW